MRAVLTPDDLKKGDLAETGWWPAEIVDYTEKEADTDKSTNCIFHFKLIDGPSKGLTANKLFNEKALGFGKNLWPLIGVPRTPDGGFDCSTEAFRAGIGKRMKIYIGRGKSNKGNEFNDVKDFMSL